MAELGTRFEVLNTSIKKWSVGSPLQSVLDSMAVLMQDPAVRAGNIKRIVVEVRPVTSTSSTTIPTRICACSTSSR